jgi:hypothetical protein
VNRGMEILTAKATRQSTRLRVRILLTVASLDRVHPFSAKCTALVVSAQGCGLSAPQALPLETPVLLSDLPGARSASGRVASCLPLGNDGKQFLIGVALYNHGNVWGIADPPEDWKGASSAPEAAPSVTNNAVPRSRDKDVWPYNLFSGRSETNPRGR